MITIKSIREAIENNTLDDFQLQEFVKFYAERFDTIDLGTELAFKEYCRKGAYHLGIELEDLQAVFNSYRKRG